MLRAPTDVMRAHEIWQASCGPAALAAAFGVDVDDVRRHVTGSHSGISKGYMGIRDMRTALGRRMGATWSSPDKDLLQRPGAARVVLLSWCGPWDDVPRAAATYRHWIANAVTDAAMVYDVNEDEWMTLAQWEADLYPQLMPRRGTGWKITWAAEAK